VVGLTLTTPPSGRFCLIRGSPSALYGGAVLEQGV
jgi:hypothetical protein